MFVTPPSPTVATQPSSASNQPLTLRSQPPTCQSLQISVRVPACRLPGSYGRNGGEKEERRKN